MKRNSLGLAGVLLVVMAAGAQTKTTVKESSSSGTLTTTASGGQGGTSSPVKDDLFTGTEVFSKGASDVTEITMDPDTLGLVGGKDKARAHGMVLNVVRTYSYDKPGMYRIEDVEVFRNKLNSGDWHCSVHTRSLKTGESTDVCSKRRSDDLSEQAIITVEPKSLTFIHTIRKRGPGESDVSEMPMLLGLHGMPALAMLDPQVFLDLKLQLDDKDMKEKLDKAKKQMHDADKALTPPPSPAPATPLQ